MQYKVLNFFKKYAFFCHTYIIRTPERCRKGRLCRKNYDHCRSGVAFCPPASSYKYNEGIRIHRLRCAVPQPYVPRCTKPAALRRRGRGGDARPAGAVVDEGGRMRSDWHGFPGRPCSLRGGRQIYIMNWQSYIFFCEGDCDEKDEKE